MNEIEECCIALKKKKNKWIIFSIFVVLLICFLVCFLVFYQQGTTVDVVVKDYSYNTSSYNYYNYAATTVQEEGDNKEYKLYVDNKLITSKSSSKNEVEFHDVKIKKGSILRTEVLPLSNQKKIKEAELTITQDVLDRINKRNGQKVITIYCR